MSRMANGHQIIKNLSGICAGYKDIKPPTMTPHEWQEKPEAWIWDAKEQLGTSDDAHIVGAMIKTIVTSDNPNIRAMWEELYTFTKLCVDGSEPFLVVAEESVKRVKRRNDQIDRDNASRKAAYESAVATKVTQHDEELKRLHAWWDEYVVRLNRIYKTSKGPHRDIIDRAVTFVKEQQPGAFPKSPLEMKAADFYNESDYSSMPFFASTIAYFMDALEKRWGTWFRENTGKLDAKVRKDFPYSSFAYEWERYEYEREYYGDDDYYYSRDPYKRNNGYLNDMDLRDEYEREVAMIVKFEIEKRTKAKLEGWTNIF